MKKRSPLLSFARTLQKQALRTARKPLRLPKTARNAAIDALLAPVRPPVGGAGSWTHGMAVGAAGARRYRLFRPASPAWLERFALLVMLHGCDQDSADFARSTRITQLALRERFCVLFVEQERSANLQRCWNWFDTRSGRAQAEAQSILSAIDQVQALYPIDRQRVAVAGLSAGAGMAALLAARHPQRFRAVVMHSGVPPGMAHSSAVALRAMLGHREAGDLPAAEPSTWPGLLVIHGAEDRVVSPRNARAAAKAWALAVDAQAQPARPVHRGKRHRMDVTDFVGHGRTVARLCEVDRLGHAWSGGAPRQRYSDPLGPDANRLIWTFVKAQFDRTAAP